MHEFFYRFENFDLIPGNKSAGFVAVISTEVLQKLRLIKVEASEYQFVMMRGRERIQRAGLLPKKLLSCCGFDLMDGSACPRMFTVSAVFGGSIGANPEALDKLQRSDAADWVGQTIAFTPHNVDTPSTALALMLLIQTWAEWVRPKLSRN